MNNDYLDSETRSLENEIKLAKKNKRSDNRCFIMLAMIIPMFFFTLSADAKPVQTKNTENVKKGKGNGKNFKCRDCNVNYWMSTDQADWMGKYYCSRCGKALN